jgi:class 3 adenylate cyclase
MQKVLLEYDKDKEDEDKVLLCVGLGYGRMLRIGDLDVYGAEVNAAGKLGEDTAKAWEVLVTKAVRDLASDMPGIKFEAIAETPPGAEQAFRLIWR